ncbi:MAG: phosphoglycolate phosphatase [Burkholderiales bacterium]|nr:phosphoglycolate phosphatase [Burkholderiales bacterium]
MPAAIFFDLDGTFADTAPDLARAMNRMRESRGLVALPLAVTRPVTSLGARGLLGRGFGITPDHPDYRALREEFLGIYESGIARETRLFPGTGELIDALEARGAAWGIVTNKAERLARILLERLGVAARARCIIGGDTTPHTKPHPAPLLAACRVSGVDATACLYLGDDRRDIEAARAAGMRSAAVRWGYLNGGNPEEWGADWLLENPLDVLRILQSMG